MVGSSLVDTRSVFQKRQKWKILIFRFCRYQVLGVKPPNAVIRFFNGKECALWESFLRLFRRNEEACIPSLLLKNENPIKWGL